MVLSNILSSLKLSTRELKAADKAIASIEYSNKPQTPSQVVVPRHDEVRTAFNNAIADLSLVASLVAKYQAVLRGIPLDYDIAIIDRFSDTVGPEGEQALVQEFMSSIAGGTGLEYYLCGQDSGSTNMEEWATEDEIFATYRAIGSTGSTEFELGVHRAVWKAEETAIELAVKVEEMVKDEKTVKNKEKGVKNKEKGVKNKEKSVKKGVKKGKKANK